MTRIDARPLGAPAWVDLGVDDPVATAGFYADVLGWSFEAAAGDWHGAQVDGAEVAGIGRRDSPTTPVMWTVYLRVIDVDTACSSIRDNGGAVMLERMDIDMDGHRLGSIAIATDPEGAVFGLWQPVEHPGIQVIDEPGAPTWFELFARDSLAESEFYRRAFGLWAATVAEPTPGNDVTLTADGEPVAEIHRMDATWPAEIPAHWAVTFEVDDVDEAVRRALASGGSVASPPAETAYGRVAALRDPEGAWFRISTPVG